MHLALRILISDLPALNATLNGIAGLFLLAGYYFIRRRQIARHRASMIGAFAMSTLFLICTDLPRQRGLETISGQGRSGWCTSRS